MFQEMGVAVFELPEKKEGCLCGYMNVLFVMYVGLCIDDTKTSTLFQDIFVLCWYGSM